MNRNERLQNKLSPECRFLLKCMNGSTNIQNDEKIDWNVLLNYAVHHRLYPVLYPNLMKSNLSVEGEFLQALETRYRENTFKMLYFTSEMERLSTRFASETLHVLFLKGPILAELYGDISFRTSSDLDVLVPINELDQLNRLLEKDGFVREDREPTILNDWKWRQHHTVYKHHETGLKLEVHWRLHPGPGEEVDFYTLWERKQQHQRFNGQVYSLGQEDLFVFLIIHGARHGWFRLRWLMDIHQMIQLPLNWTLICTILKRYYRPAVAGQALILVSELFQTSIPNELAHLMTKKAEKLALSTMYYLEDLVDPHTEPLPREISLYNRRYLFSLMSFRKKCLVVLSYLYPYPEDAQTLKLPQKLQYLYFPLRPILWAWRKARRVAST